MDEIERREPEVIRHQVPVTTLQLECGCEYSASHPSGSTRVFHCPHQDWLIRALKQPPTKYVVETFPKPAPTDVGRSDTIKDLLG